MKQLNGAKASGAEIARLEALLADCNGNRKTRLLTMSQVGEAIGAALADPHGQGVVHGGEANDGNQVTTLVFAARDGSHVTVGVGVSGARGAGPGRTWKALQPWSRDPEKNRERVAEWAKKKAPDRVRLAAGDAPARSSDRDQAMLLAAVLARPDDDGPRLVYADWLSEREDPRGTFIVLQCKGDLRADGLLRQHGDAWTAKLRQFTLKQTFRRGFVEGVVMRGAAFATRADTLFSLEPVQELHLRNVTLGDVRHLAASKHLPKLRTLELDKGDGLSDRGALLLGKTNLRGLKTLIVTKGRFSGDGWRSVLAAASRLEELELGALSDEVAELVLGLKSLRTLRAGMPKSASLRRAIKARFK